MKKEKVDRRIKYTKMVIKDSFLELLKQKPISKISVTELCIHADINRGTFYKHYVDVYCLLKEIETELTEEIFLNLENFLNTTEKNLYDFTFKLFEYFKENKKIFKIIFSDHGNKDFIIQLYYSVYDNLILDWSKKNPNVDKKTLDYIFTFMANGTISVVQKWLETGLKENTNEIATFINNICEHGFHKFISL